MRNRPSRVRRTILHRVVALLAAVATAGLAGCGSKTVNVAEQAAPPPAATPATYDDGPWTDVLRDNVRNGAVDYRHLAAHPEPLDRFLAGTRYAGPTRTPGLFKEPRAALVYYMNVFNACVLKAVLTAGIPPTMHDVRRVDLENGYRFQVDGRNVTLADLRARVYEHAAGDGRVALGLCTAAAGSPPLDNRPFRPDSIDEHLARIAQAAMDNPNLVRISHEDQQLLVGLAIWSRREALAEWYCRDTGSRSATMLNCLMQMASGMRRQYLVRATGYDVRMLPFDRRLNAWQPAP